MTTLTHEQAQPPVFEWEWSIAADCYIQTEKSKRAVSEWLSLPAPARASRAKPSGSSREIARRLLDLLHVETNINGHHFVGHVHAVSDFLDQALDTAKRSARAAALEEAAKVTSHDPSL